MIRLVIATAATLIAFCYLGVALVDRDSAVDCMPVIVGVVLLVVGAELVTRRGRYP